MRVPNYNMPMRFYASVYLSVAGIYLLTASGRIGLSDNVAMFNVAQSIVNNGSFSSEPCDPNLAGHPNHCVPGRRHGRYYAGFGLVPSIVAVPAVVGGKLVSKLAHVNSLAVMRLSVSLLTALISPLVCGVLAMWIVGLGYSRRTAVVAAGILAFGSPFWHYAVKGFYSEPYFTLGLVLAAYLASCSERPYTSSLSGLAFGAACGSRVIGMIMFPAFILFLFLKNRERKLSGALFREVAFFTISFLACAALIGWSNYARFGDVLKTGYQAAFPSTSTLISNPLFRGMADLLFNNEVGLFVFAPWIVLSLIAFPLFFRQHQSEATLCGTIFLSNFIFFALYPSWHGGMVAGPRLLVATLPFLVLLLVPYIDGLRRQAQPRKGGVDFCLLLQPH